MREILFRGKQVTDKKWVFGGIDTTTEEKPYIIRRARYRPDTRDFDTAEYYEKNPHYNRYCIEVIPETIGQWTGLVDKNGKKIFEGDIVKAMMDHGPGGFMEQRIIVEFAYACGGYQWQYFDMTTMEVIGNIHDDSRLLKGETT